MVVGVPLGIKIVVAPSQPRVERTFCLSLFGVDLTVIMLVLPRENLHAATEDPKAVCQGVLSIGDVRVEILQRFLVESNPRRCSFRPVLRWPDYGRSG
jgi:hypothetical protein